jgi:hypothetical protein
MGTPSIKTTVNFKFIILSVKLSLNDEKHQKN